METNYTPQQIQAAAQARLDHNLDVEDNWDELGEEYWEGWRALDWFELDGEKVLVTMLDQTGGPDERRNNTTVVFQVGTQIFLKEGWYDDYAGFEWDGDIYEVEHHQVLVTHYKRKV